MHNYRDKSNDIFSVLEVHITDHCNLNCASCFHYAPLAKPKLYSIDEFRLNMEILKPHVPETLHIHFLGGEPLLHPDILDFFKVYKQIFPKGYIKLITNGILFLNKPNSFFDELNALDVLVTWSKYKEAPYLELLIKSKIKNYDIYEHTKLTYQYLNFNSNYTDKYVFDHCEAGIVPTLKDGFIYKCNFEAWLPFLLEYFKLDYPVGYVRDANRISLSDPDLSRDKLNALISQPSTFCRYCQQYVDNNWTTIPWRLSAKELSEWVKPN